MVDVEVFKFPTLEHGRRVVETTLCEYINRHRNGEPLAPEVLDWMDTANNWLTVETSR